MAKIVKWMSVLVDCDGCKKTSRVVLGTTTKEDKPITTCPRCKGNQITIRSVTPCEAAA